MMAEWWTEYRGSSLVGLPVQKTLEEEEEEEPPIVKQLKAFKGTSGTHYGHFARDSFMEFPGESLGNMHVYTVYI